MTIQRFLIVLMKWLAAFALASGIVMLIRLFCIESYRISTDSMEEALHKGDYILVNKIPGKNKGASAESRESGLVKSTTLPRTGLFFPGILLTRI